MFTATSLTHALEFGVFFSFFTCEQRSLLSWSITRRGVRVCAQMTCRNTGVEVLVVTQKENRRL